MTNLERIERSIQFIEKNLTYHITLQDIADSAFFSPAHFSRMFHMAVGDSLRNYLRERRLTAAARRLLDGNERIIDIALTFRFESQAAFTRSFKKHFGISPAAFRQGKNCHSDNKG